MRAATRSGIGLGVSVLAHVGLAAALWATVPPRDMPQQKIPPSRIDLLTAQVPQRQAPQKRPERRDAPEQQPSGLSGLGQSVPNARVAALAAPSQRMAVLAAPGEVIVPDANRATTVVAKAPQTLRLNDSVPAETASALGVQVEGIYMASAQTAGTQTTATTPTAVLLDRAALPVVKSDDLGTGGERVIIVAATGAALAERQIQPILASPAAPQPQRVVARLAWSADQSEMLGSKGLETLQAFLTPEGPQGKEVRDQIAALIAAPECARVQTAFDPAEGALELRGHVPNDALRSPLVAAMRAQIGEGFPIEDHLRILPAPQCGVLGGMETLGLPQSEEQLNDPLLIGKPTQALEMAFAEGQRMIVDLQAPDYPAYLYVDYFDSAGQVIHLMPNDKAPLKLFQPADDVSLGREGGVGYEVRIAPPFGQDIAVAFATDVPLYEGLRPVVEEVDTYLSFLRDRIAEVRPEKGEWFYLFVSTGPKWLADDN